MDTPTPTAAHWHAREQQLLEGLLRHLGAHGEPDPLLQGMLEQMAALLGLDHGRIALLTPGTDQAHIRYACGLTQAEAARGIYALGEGVTGHVLASGQSMVVQDIDAEPLFLTRSMARKRLPGGAQAYLAVPIQVGPRTVGVLGCHRILQPGRTLDEDLALLRILAALAGHQLQWRQLAHPATPPLVRAYLAAGSHTAAELERALAEHLGHHGHAAQALGLTQRQFNYRLRKARGG